MLNRNFFPYFFAMIPDEMSNFDHVYYHLYWLDMRPVLVPQVDKNSHKYHNVFYPNPYRSVQIQTMLHLAMLDAVDQQMNNPPVDKNKPCQWVVENLYDLRVGNDVVVQETVKQ